MGARKLYFVDQIHIEYNGFSTSKCRDEDIWTLGIFDTKEKAEKYLEDHGHKHLVSEMDYGVTNTYVIRVQYVDIDICEINNESDQKEKESKEPWKAFGITEDAYYNAPY